AATTTTASGTTTTASTAAATTTRAAAATTARTAEATAASTTGATGGALLRLVHCKGTAVENGAVHGAHGLLSRSLVSERHKAETARTAGVTIGHHLGVVNLSKTLKCRAETVVVSVPAEAAYQESITHSVFHF